MANTTYINANRLTEEVAQSRTKIIRIGLMVIVAITLVVGLQSHSPSEAVEAATFGLIVLGLAVVASVGGAKQAGAEGEDDALIILDHLPESYYLFNQLKVPNSESRNGFTELDFVVLGPNGLFVIEVKSINGHIVGTEDDYQWIIYKTGRKGGSYTADMNNPIKQIKRQIWALKTFLQSHELSPWITGAVLFPNPATTLDIDGTPSIPLFEGGDVLRHIQGSKTRPGQSFDSPKLLNALIGLSQTPEP